MREIIRIEEKKVLLDTETDALLIGGREYERRRTGADNCTRWESLYAHRRKDGTHIFYVHHVTVWQGEYCCIEMISKDEAEKKCEENVDYFRDEEIAALKKIGIDLLEGVE